MVTTSVSPRSLRSKVRSISDLSIRAKVSILLVGTLVTAIAADLVIFDSLDKAKKDADIVNALGRQRMLSQAMSKSVLGYAMTKSNLRVLEQKVFELDALISGVRGVYTEQVIAPSREAGLTVSQNPRAEDHIAVPFPATFIRLVTERVGALSTIEIDILSEDPINPEQGFSDQRDRDAFASLSRGTTKLYQTSTQADGQLYLRFYTPDPALVQGCVDCHNALTGREFKVGDVLGVRRFTLLFAEDVELGLSRMRPSLHEYDATRQAFRETLTAMKSGGRLPVDLEMATYAAFEGLKDPDMLAKVDAIEREANLYEASVEQLDTSPVASESFWLAQEDIQERANRLHALSDDLVVLYARYANHKQANIGRSVLIMLVVVAVAILLIGTLVKNVVASLGQLSDMLEPIAAGKGDLTKRVEVAANDEIGLVGQLFNTFIGGLQVLIKDTVEAFGVISDVVVDVNSYTESMDLSARKQIEAVDETAASVAQMNSAIKSVATETEEQLELTQFIAASVHGMHTSISEVADNADAVSSSAEQTTSSINKIASSLRAVSVHVDSLFCETEDAVSSSEHVARVVQTVTEHARKQAAIAAKVKEDASLLGLDAVEKTIEGMQKIRQESMATAKIIGELEERSSKITQVTQVITEITDTTKLLSLNAAIIAAQAGEHGKSFSVVAEQVKGLARRTTQSTKEITDLIGLMQDGVVVAKQSMEINAAGIEEGVNLSINARKVLETIVKSTESSLEVAQTVEDAAEDQARGLARVTQSIQKMNTMVDGIKQAAGEQGLVSEEILVAANNMLEVTVRVKGSTKEQRDTSERIAAMIAEMADRMTSITGAATEQRAASEKIVLAVEIVKHEVEGNVDLVGKLGHTVKELDDKRAFLQDKVESFNV